MKKLMIAAAIVAMGGAVLADDCGLDCVYAYRIKLAGKTVTGKSTGAKNADCEVDCWAKPCSLRIAGYFYGATEAGECEGCECQDMSDAASHFWGPNKKALELEGAFEIFDVLRNGGAKDKAQIGIKIGDIYCAGFGVFNPNTQRLKNASGFFAGTYAAPSCAGAWNAEDCEYGDDTVAQIFKPCELAEAVDCEAGIAYGRWALAWKHDKVAQIAKTGSYACLYPTGWDGEIAE